MSLHSLAVTLLTIVLLSPVVYRVSRFIVLDTIIDRPRDRILGWMELRRHGQRFWFKLIELLGCPYCITVWVAAATVAVQHFVVAPVHVPIWTWLGVATGAVIIWGIVDSDEAHDDHDRNPTTD